MNDRRPRSATPDQLGFTPQRMVRWLSPRELGRAGVSVLLSSIFGVYSDKRELQQGGVFDQGAFRHDQSDELWLDYVSDLGDGFDATYSVASMLAREKLDVDTQALPRGQILVMGGDEVYPVADAFAYEEKTTRVYATAFPQAPADPPTLYAVPGNHDWYDGLTAFLRVFAQGQSIGGWRTAQRRSYFALQLPHRWWLLAIDIQLDTYIDAPQLAYFTQVAGQIEPGDGIILCTAKPSWYGIARGDDRSFDRLAYFTEQVLAGKQAQVRLVLTGDVHHYARYTCPETSQTLLTSGLGGAYTSATHRLDERIELPPRLARPGGTDQAPVTYQLSDALWPPRAKSRQLAWGVFRLPWRNPGFWALLGTVQAGFITALLAGNPVWSVVAGLLTLLGLVLFASPERHGFSRKVLFGLPHGLAQVGLGCLGYLLGDRLTDGWARAPALIACAVAAAVVVGFLAAELVAGYLLLASLARTNVNELFAAQSLEDHKGFVRLRVGQDGLRVYPIGLARVGRHWQADPGAAADEPCLVPRTPLRPQFIEAPFTITRGPTPVVSDSA